MEDQDNIKTKRKRHPKSKANVLSRLFYCWELPLFVKYQKTDFNENDLYEPLEEYDSKSLGDKLEELWSEEKKIRDIPSLWRVVIKCFGLKFIIIGLIYSVADLTVYFFQPLFLRKLLDYYMPEQTEITKQQACWYSAYIIFLTFLKLMNYHAHKSLLGGLTIKLRVAFSSIIYRKSLTLTRANFLNITVGHMVNLLSNDVGRLQWVYLNYLWKTPLEIILIGYYLDVSIGHVALAGFGAILFLLLVQLFLPNKISNYRKETSLESDYRIRLMDDLIHGIKVIKIFAWEKPFSSLVASVRKSELDHIRKANYLRTMTILLPFVSSKGSMFLFLLGAVLTQRPLTSQNVFVVFLYYEIFTKAVYLLTQGTHALTEIHLSLHRIREFLMTNEASNKKSEENCILTSDKSYQNGEKGVRINNLCIKWDLTSTAILNKVTLDAFSGDLVGVIGAAGSGKSTLLQAILHENIISKGNIEINGILSYACQDPWIFSASVKQNILFGAKIDEERYHQVTKVCALEHDLSLFLHGDKTLVGERGMMLSGGQKARINLARAIYRKADIYLLDDPLSAVDTNVGMEIFTRCILGFLKDKCVVLVTHQLRYLQNCKKVYIVDDGRIRLNQESKELVTLTNILNQTRKNSLTKGLRSYPQPEEAKEHRSESSNTRKTYRTYYFSGGNCGVISLLFFLFLASQFVMSSADYFLAFWISLDQDSKGLYDKFKKILTTYNHLYIYMFLTLMLIVVFTTTIIIFCYYCANASSVLHDKILSKILRSPMSFFNQHSSGRILNRFSKDLWTIDEAIPLSLMETLSYVFYSIAVYVLICILHYWMVFPAIVLCLLYYAYSCIFTPVNKNLKRTEAITHSPVLTHLSDSLQGLTTIRAFKAQTILEEEFDNHETIHCTADYLLFGAYMALGFWTDFTCLIYTVLLVFTFLFFEFDLYAANIGLAITQSIGLMRIGQKMMRTWSVLDTQMTSVERLSEYAELSSEPDSGEIPPNNWPSSGRLSFNSVCLRYSPESPLVLKRVSFEVEAGEKIGIIGRTGAGKSSLVSVILRLFTFEGQIFIDGVDTKTISLNSLRSNISVIPQEPVLFLGTLRRNLDPFDSFSDAQLWKALEEVELKGMVSGLSSGLDSIVSEGGCNFSVGQRQLLCLGRTLLKNSKIIVLDEATANVDLETDKLIQATIRRKFQDSTVLTIAHRLDTVMDSDKILVMEDGCVVEFDHPSRLLANPDGVFFEYCKRNKNNVKD